MKAIVGVAKRLSSNESGNVAPMFALMAVQAFVLVGAAVEYGYALKVQTTMQSASDAAALAAAALPSGTADSQRISTASAFFTANSNALGVNGVTPNVSISGSTISVNATVDVPTTLLRLARLDKFTVGGSAQATYSVASTGGSICMLALDPNSNDGIHVQGTGDVNYPGCWAQTNSTRSTAINASGNASAVVGAGHCAAGGVSVTHDNFTPAAVAGCGSVDDPFATVGAYSNGTYTPTFTPPTIPSSCASNNLNLKKGSYSLNPGRYCGGLSLQAQVSVTLAPGIYFIDNGTLNVQSGASLSGSNVLIYFTGANASMTVIGGGTINLKGRNPGSSYSSFLFIADTANHGGTSNIQGGGSMTLEGVLYMPTQTILVTGNGTVNSTNTYFGMVAANFLFEGNGVFNMATTGSTTTLTDIMPAKTTTNKVQMTH